MTATLRQASLVEAGTPVPLFATPVCAATADAGVHQYIVSPDGQRFLMSPIVEEAATSPITVILNWKAKP